MVAVVDVAGPAPGPGEYLSSSNKMSSHLSAPGPGPGEQPSSSIKCLHIQWIPLPRLFLVHDPATVTGPGQAQGGLAGPALAPGPAPSKFTSLNIWNLI